MTQEIILNKYEWKTLPNNTFKETCFGKETKNKTNVEVKIDDKFLHVRFNCLNNPYVANNYLTKHNDALYNQEVFELFIATGSEDPTDYLEFEINPNNAIWTGKMNNPTFEGDSLSSKMVAYEDTGIKHSVDKKEDSWSGQFSIPLSLIGEVTDAYRFNFYRIIAKQKQEDPNWACTKENSLFTGYYPTLSGENPAFHKPKSFGVLRVK